MEYGPYSHFTQPNKTIGVVWDVIDVLQQISVQQQYDYEEAMELWTHTCLHDLSTLSETSCGYRLDEALLTVKYQFDCNIF